MKAFRLKTLFASAVLATTIHARGADYSWNGTADSDPYATAGKWRVGGAAATTAPGAGDNIVNPANTTIVYSSRLAANQEINNFTLDSTFSLSWTLVSGASGVNSTYTINGALTQSAGALTFRNNNNSGTALSLIIKNGITLNGGTLNFGGVLSAGANSPLTSLSVSGGTIVNGGVLNFNSASANLTGGLTINGGTVNVIAAANGAGSGGIAVDALFGSGGVIRSHSERSNEGALIINGNDTAGDYGGLVADGVGALSVVKSGNGSQTFSGVNTYSGGTRIAGGTLLITNSAGLGSGAVQLNGGTLKVSVGDGGLIANPVTFGSATGRYLVDRLAGQNYAGYSASSSQSGIDTTAKLLGGLAEANRNLVTLFKTDASAGSDVFTISGFGGDVFVLQLSVANVSSGSYLGSFNGSVWVKAAAANSGNNASGVQQGFLGSFSEFQSLYGADLAAYVGAYGTDLAGQSVWAVLNHDGQFAVTAVPEPQAVALLIGGGILLVFLPRKRSRLNNAD